MHFISFEHQGNIKLGALLPDGSAAGELSALGFEREFENMVHFIQTVTESELSAAESRWNNDNPQRIPVDEIRLLAPITRAIHDILCVGINYRAHQEESEEFFSLQGKKDEQHI